MTNTRTIANTRLSSNLEQINELPELEPTIEYPSNFRSMRESLLGRRKLDGKGSLLQFLYRVYNTCCQTGSFTSSRAREAAHSNVSDRTIKSWCRFIRENDLANCKRERQSFRISSFQNLGLFIEGYLAPELEFQPYTVITPKDNFKPLCITKAFDSLGKNEMSDRDVRPNPPIPYTYTYNPLKQIGDMNKNIHIISTSVDSVDNRPDLTEVSRLLDDMERDFKITPENKRDFLLYLEVNLVTSDTFEWALACVCVQAKSIGVQSLTGIFIHYIENSPFCKSSHLELKEVRDENLALLDEVAWYKRGHLPYEYVSQDLISDKQSQDDNKQEIPEHREQGLIKDEEGEFFKGTEEYFESLGLIDQW